MNNLKFKELENDCPECGNLVFFRKNFSQGYYCLKSECNYGYATTYIPEILKDCTVYEVYISSLGDNWKQAIVFLALKFNLNLKEARKFKTLKKLLFTGNAAEVFKIRSKLQEKGIKIKILPTYKYDVWDNLPQGEFSIDQFEAKELKYLLEGE